MFLTTFFSILKIKEIELNEKKKIAKIELSKFDYIIAAI